MRLRFEVYDRKGNYLYDADRGTFTTDLSGGRRGTFEPYSDIAGMIKVVEGDQVVGQWWIEPAASPTR